jgi:hypothetical protein
LNPIRSVLVLVLNPGGIGVASLSMIPGDGVRPLYALPCFAAARVVGLSLKMANTWEEPAALKITNYREATDRVAQASLREMIGSSVLPVLLSDRQTPDEHLRVETGAKTAPRRISVGSAEGEVASRLDETATTYAAYPIALQSRTMNIIYETTKERGATILIPTANVDTMNPASPLVLAGLAARTKFVPAVRKAA